VSICLCLCASVCLYVCVYVSLCLRVCVSVCPSLYPSLSLALSLACSVSRARALSFSFSLSISLAFTLAPSLSLVLSLCLALVLSLSSPPPLFLPSALSPPHFLVLLLALSCARERMLSVACTLAHIHTQVMMMAWGFCMLNGKSCQTFMIFYYSKFVKLCVHTISIMNTSMNACTHDLLHAEWSVVQDVYTRLL